MDCVLASQCSHKMLAFPYETSHKYSRIQARPDLTLSIIKRKNSTAQIKVCVCARHVVREWQLLLHALERLACGLASGAPQPCGSGWIVWLGLPRGGVVCGLVAVVAPMDSRHSGPLAPTSTGFTVGLAAGASRRSRFARRDMHHHRHSAGRSFISPTAHQPSIITISLAS